MKKGASPKEKRPFTCETLVRDSASQSHLDISVSIVPPEKSHGCHEGIRRRRTSRSGSRLHASNCPLGLERYNAAAGRRRHRGCFGSGRTDPLLGEPLPSMPRRARCALGAAQGKGCTVRVVAIELRRVAVRILFRFVVIAVGTAVQADDHTATGLFQWRNIRAPAGCYLTHNCPKRRQ